MSKKCTVICNESGTSLVIVSMFIIAMGLLSAAGLQLFNQYSTAKRQVETQDSLLALRSAMIDYYSRNGRFPCPAPFDSNPAENDFARESSAPCNATGNGGGGGGGGGLFEWIFDGVLGMGGGPGHGHGPGGSQGGSSGTVRTTGHDGKKIRIGTVPTRTLNLPDKDGTDSYGHRIVYAVVENMATTGAATTSTPGAIRLRDFNNNNASRSFVTVILFSHGNDIRGAWDINGTLLSPCDDNSKAGENCDYDSDFVNSAYKRDHNNDDEKFVHRLVYITPDMIGR